MSTVACLPAYNEEKKISDIVTETMKYVDSVIVCDDGSNDRTLKMAQKAGAYVVRHDQNLGKGAALKTMFKIAKQMDADITVTMDSDGQLLPEEIPILVNSLIKNKSDIVTGNRFNDNKEMPKYRKFGNKVLDKVTNMAMELQCKDTQSGFRAYSKKAINMIEFSTNGFGVDSEILINAASKGLKISEEPITVIYNTNGKTSTKDPISHSTSVLTNLVELIAIKKPLKFLGIPGIIFIILGVSFSIIVIGVFNDTRYFSLPFTLLSLGSFTIGLLLMLMSTVLYSISKANRVFQMMNK